MSLPEDPLVPKTDIPPILSENISANSDTSNPYSTPSTTGDSNYLQFSGKAADLGIGYWLAVFASVLIIILTLAVEPMMAIPTGWVAFFSALRVPLRDVRRSALNRPPVLNRVLYGAGDYLLSVVLVVCLSFAMCTIFLTVCTVTGLGVGAISSNGSDLISLAIGGSGVFAIISFLLLFSVSLRI